VTILNRTQFLLTPLGSYFDSGRFDLPPGDVSPFGASTFTACATDDSVLTGVTGAASYTASLPDGSCNIGVGFCNPAIGGYKTNIAFDPDQNQFTQGSQLNNPTQTWTTSPVLPPSDFTQGTYNCSVGSTVNASSSHFTGTDSDGNAVTIQFTGSAAPGPQIVVTVVQNIVSAGT
jgi:hypothetical protein